MSELSRREFAVLAGAGLLGAAATGLPFAGQFPAPAYAAAKARVVIVGGGAGGATVARHVKSHAPDLDVTLVELQKRYTTCFFSNHYIGGYRSFASITHDYDGLKKLGVDVVHDWAMAVDPTKREVVLRDGKMLRYDKLVLAPGIDLKYETIEGYDPEAGERMPHAWKAGVQTRILRRQLVDMEDGGVVVVAAPPEPSRGPDGPYERISLIAHYLKFFKPRSKLIVLDAKAAFSKQALFLEGWKTHYGDLIELRMSGPAGNQRVVRVSANTMELITADGTKEKAAVANVIPAQRAGQIAHLAGCVAGDWCPIRPNNFASMLVHDVYVLGDAAIADKMPKTAFAAHSQAVSVANDIVAKLAGKKRFPPRYRNTSWSLISTTNSVKDGASYRAGEKIVEVASQFSSKVGEDGAVRAQTFQESLDWYRTITTDMFAKS